MIFPTDTVRVAKLMRMLGAQSENDVVSGVFIEKNPKFSILDLVSEQQN